MSAVLNAIDNWDTAVESIAVDPDAAVVAGNELARLLAMYRERELDNYDADDEDDLRHTACENCGLDIEGPWVDDGSGAESWLDRGGNHLGSDMHEHAPAQVK